MQQNSSAIRMAQDPSQTAENQKYGEKFKSSTGIKEVWGTLHKKGLLTKCNRC